MGEHSIWLKNWEMYAEIHVSGLMDESQINNPWNDIKRDYINSYSELKVVNSVFTNPADEHQIIWTAIAYRGHEKDTAKIKSMVAKVCRQALDVVNNARIQLYSGMGEDLEEHIEVENAIDISAE